MREQLTRQCRVLVIGGHPFAQQTGLAWRIQARQQHIKHLPLRHGLLAEAQAPGGIKRASGGITRRNATLGIQHLEIMALGPARQQRQRVHLGGRTWPIEVSATLQ